VPFTSAFHTRFPDYAALRTGISADRFRPIVRRFHAPSRAVLVATRSLAEELEPRGVEHPRADLVRSSGDLCLGTDHPRGAACTALGHSRRGGPGDRRRLLVYCVDLFRQPGGHDRGFEAFAAL
jgi:hypothetical protein